MIHTMKVAVSILIICISVKDSHPAGCNRDREVTELTCTNITLEDENDLTVNDLDNIRKIVFINCTIPIISLGMFARFPEVVHLDVDENHIDFIEPGAFSGMHYLEVLYIDRNNISILQSAAINSLTHLVTLSVNENRLTKIEKNYFTNMIHLEYLDLGYNLIEVITANAFGGLTSLRTLGLQNNRLTSLPVGCFKDLGALEHLYLQDNSLKNLEFGLFTGLHSLTYLKVSTNKLQAITEGCLIPLRSLENLDIDGNGLTHLHANNLASALPKLNHMRLNNNSWSCSSLSYIFLVLTKHDIRIWDNTTDASPNILGISCENELVQKSTRDLLTPDSGVTINKTTDINLDIDNIKPFIIQREEQFENLKEYFDGFAAKVMVAFTILILLLLVIVSLFLYILFLRRYRRKLKSQAHTAEMTLFTKD